MPRKSTCRSCGSRYAFDPETHVHGAPPFCYPCHVQDNIKSAGVDNEPDEAPKKKRSVKRKSKEKESS